MWWGSRSNDGLKLVTMGQYHGGSKACELVCLRES
jgi:hypothetical protein